MSGVYMNKDLKKTIDWLYRHGRPIDVARYEFLFLGKNRELLEKTLSSYQNSDGGFAHGLEPDFKNPNSTALQCWMAFTVIDELKLDVNDDIVVNLLDYLVNKAPKKEGMFLSTIPSNNDYPHAQWWSYQEGAEVWGYNPTIAIAGFIYKYAWINENYIKFSRELIQRAIDDFNAKPTDEMHEIRAFLDMINYVKDLKDFNDSDKFLKKILQRIEANIEKNSELWFTTYCVRPLQFFDVPNTFAYDLYRDLAKKEAMMILDSRNTSGIWEITWQWSEYPEDRVIAKREWQSSMAIGYLKILKDHNII